MDQFGRVIAQDTPDLCLDSALQFQSTSKSSLQLAAQRQEAGQCPSCGQQLYQQSVGDNCCFSLLRSIPSASEPQQHQRVPLTIPNLVDRGQCLLCQGTENGTPEEGATTDEASSLQSALGHASLSSLSSNSPSSSHHGDRKLSPQEQARREFASALQPPPPSSDDTAYGTTKRVNPQDLPPGTAVYYGETNAQGQKHGSNGTLVWANGDVYQGDFCRDQRHGHGTLTFANGGGEYVGDWYANAMHGSGTRRYPSGDVYVGPYVHGHRETSDSSTTLGRFYYANGDLYYGPWHQNQMHGTSGRYYYASGQRFEGTFVRSKRTGVGKLQRTDGTMEIFQYINDERVGKGVRWSADRSRAWRLWMPHQKQRTTQVGRQMGQRLEKKRISVAEAVSLTYEIEMAAASYQEELA